METLFTLLILEQWIENEENDGQDREADWSWQGHLNKEEELLDGEDIDNKEVELLDGENSNNGSNDNNDMNNDKDDKDKDEDGGDDVYNNDEDDDNDDNTHNQENGTSDEEKVDDDKVVNDKENEDSDDISKGNGGENVKIWWISGLWESTQLKVEGMTIITLINDK